MEHGGETDLGAQVLGVGGDREHGVGRRFEQEIVDHGLVLVGDVGDRRRQCEHDVEVGHGWRDGVRIPSRGGAENVAEGSGAAHLDRQTDPHPPPGWCSGC